MDALALVASALLPWSAGTAALLVLRERSRALDAPGEIAWLVGAGYLVGAFALTLCMRVLTVAGLPFGRLAIAAPMLMIAAAGGWLGQGNIKADPLFAGRGRWVDGKDPNLTVRADDPGAVWVMGDYHLQSQAGRWDPRLCSWQQDLTTSPCIDAGDPATPVGREPTPNGGIVNLGVYGGTVEASRSVLPNPAP